jgi:hypothetical protein
MSAYEKLAILRDEIEQRNKELSSLDRSIDAIRETMNKRKYLWTLYPEFYKEIPPPEGAKELPGYLERKRVLETLLGKLNEEKYNLEMALKGGAVVPAQAQDAAPQQQPGRKARFASFEEFGSKQRPPRENT